MRHFALHKIQANAYLGVNGTPQLLVGNTQMLTLMLDTFASLAQSSTSGAKTTFGAADGTLVAIANLNGAR